MQGFNMGRYVPPEYEGTTSANKLAGKHALGARARKLPQGILTVRFEMPFAVWCTTCPKPTIIGQGVRFNAEKKKVGNYYSTPIYSFRMRHTACGGTIEIRTDPKNTAYVVTEGGKKRDTGEDKTLEGEIDVRTEEERERLRNDAFAALEGKVEDKRRAQGDNSRVEELQVWRDRDWADPYLGSQKLRKTFRMERKARERRIEATEALKGKLSIGIDLLEETEDDRLRAGFVEFGEWGADDAVERAKTKPLFAANLDHSGHSGTEGSKAEKAKPGHKTSTKRSTTNEATSKKKKMLQDEIRSNTRAAIDPFLGNHEWSAASTQSDFLQGLKRKQPAKDGAAQEDTPPGRELQNEVNGMAMDETESQWKSVKILSALVDYDSD